MLSHAQMVKIACDQPVVTSLRSDHFSLVTLSTGNRSKPGDVVTIDYCYL